MNLLASGKASEYFAPFQFGIACPAGAEKVIHGLRHCIEEHWEEEDFVVLKIDICNAFNLVSRQALLDECAFHFPDLLPWASWCYGQQPLLQHPLGTLTSEVGVQQGDPLGPMFFSLVLHKLVSAIATDDNTAKLLFHAWYLDDGVVAGPKQSVLHALAIIQELGPPLGLVINPSKCELYSQNDMSVFSSQMKQSNMPHLEILGSPIGVHNFLCLTLCLKNVHRPLNCFLRLRMLALLTPKLLYFCYGCVAHFVKWCTRQDPHPLLLLLKDSGILITTFVIALLHAQEWTPVMTLGSRHNSA